MQSSWLFYRCRSAKETALNCEVEADIGFLERIFGRE